MAPLYDRARRGEAVILQDMLLPVDRHGEVQDAWWNVHYLPVRDESGAIAGVFCTVIESTPGVQAKRERECAEAALRDSEERQAFLLKLSDALRPLANPARIKAVATRLLGEHLAVNRVFYADAEDGRWLVTKGYERDIELLPEQPFEMVEYGTWIIDKFRAGERLVVNDMTTDARFDKSQRAAHLALQIGAEIALPLLKNDELVAMLVVHTAGPRKWSEREMIVLEQTAERTWAAVERARAEVLLRESEERFRQFAEASSGALWIRDASTLSMEYVSPAIERVYGVESKAILGDLKYWAALIVPEDRDIAMTHIKRARDGEAVVHEFRIQRASDQSFRWIRDTDFPLLDDRGRVQRIGGIAEDVTEAKLAIEHQSVLLAELQHRVRNIMANIRSIAAGTSQRAKSVPEYADLLAGRLRALARVQALLTRAANISVGISTIVHDELSVQAQHEGQYVLDGPDIELSPKAAEILTLAIHELATNALKYGALSAPNGKVIVQWAAFQKRGAPWLSFNWKEEGAPVRQKAARRPHRRGFGSELIEGRVPYELGGRGRVVIESGGARCHLEFPLREDASILETDAPQQATVFGGALDMTGESSLSGQRVLVVEDDYYLATDAARALQGAGAEVLGPFPTEEAARAEVEKRCPDAVVVDINLGAGPSFKLAEALKDRGVPFVFVTGYDQEMIPKEFDHIQRLEKPIQLRQIVNAISKLVA
jgi:PAS domain S-box-containing protein